MLALVWSLLSNFLIVEVLMLTAFALPLVSALQFHDILRSHAFMIVRQWKNGIFISLLVPFALLTLNSIRQAVGLTQPESDASQTDVLLAQRNLCIAAAATMLWVMIWCTIHLVEKLGSLELELAAARKRLANAASAAAATSSATASGSAAGQPLQPPPARLAVVVEAAVEAERTRRELAETRVALERATERLHRAELDLSAMRRQAEGTNRAFDELLAEHQRLQQARQPRSSGSSGGDTTGKKDN